MFDKLKSVPAWAIRKVVYFAAALVIAVLGAFGLLSEFQVDQWTENIDKILVYATGVGGFLFAGSKTNAGSDSTVTAADIDRSRSGARDDIREEIQQQMQTLTEQFGQELGVQLSRFDHLPESVQEKVRSLYESPYGRHEQVAASEPDGSGPSRYPGA